MPPCTVAWVRFVFQPAYVQLMIDRPREWHHVVIGDHRSEDIIVPEKYISQVPVQYCQGNLDRCLFLCLALALYYMGLTQEAAKLSSMSHKAETLPGGDVIKALLSAMKACAPSLCIPTIFQDGHKKKSESIQSKI